MADIVLPVPGENPNWGTKLNTAILRINQELESLGVRVSIVESGLSSLTLRVTNLEGRVTDLEDNLEDLVRDIAADVIASDPTIIQAAEDAVAAEVEGLGVLVGIPTSDVPKSGRTSLPVEWTHRVREAPYPATYTATYEGGWVDQGRYQRDVPLLNDAGFIPNVHISPSIARLSDIPEPPPIEVEPTRRIVVPQLPIFAARVEVARHADTAVGIVFAGSSTTGAMPGYVQGTLDLVQGLWPLSTQTDVVRRADGDFTWRTQPGIHGYNVGLGGTTTADYLTDEVCDRLAGGAPALMIHMVGGSNDYTAQIDPAVVQSNLESRLAYLDSVLPAPCQHLLVMQYARQGFTPPTYEHAEYLAALEAVAAGRPETTVTLDLSDDYRALGIPGPDPLDLISGDGTHQTSAGYAVMQTRVAAGIVQ